MQKEEIIFESFDKKTGKRILILLENDGNSIYTYYLSCVRKIIQFSCLGYLKEAKKHNYNISFKKNNNLRPPLTLEWATKYSYLPNIKNSEISVEWKFENMIIVLINKVPFQFFLNEMGEKYGYSKSILKKGMFGNPWSEEKFQHGKNNQLEKTIHFCCPTHNEVILFIETKKVKKSINLITNHENALNENNNPSVSLTIPIHENPEICNKCLSEKIKPYSYLKHECKIKNVL